MRILILLGLTIFILNSSSAQPGYQGKKLSGGYNIYLFPSWINPNFKGNSEIYSLNSAHQLKVDYVVERKTSIGFTYSFSRTSFDYNLQVFNKNIYADNPIKLYSHGPGIYIRSYYSKPGNIAPVGSYVEFDLLTFSNLIVDKAADDKINRFQNVQLGLTLGKQRVTFNKFLFDFGVRLAYLTPHIASSASEFETGYNPTIDAGDRLRSQYLVNFKFGIALLANRKSPTE